MIEKISVDRTNEMGTVVLQCVNKINELVDVCDALMAGREDFIHCNTLTEVNLTTVDPYAEQRKWIGSLVEYGNAEDGFRYGILTNIDPTFKALVNSEWKEYPFEIDNGRKMVADCWLPSETVFYKG